MPCSKLKFFREWISCTLTSRCNSQSTNRICNILWALSVLTIEIKTAFEITRKYNPTDPEAVNNRYLCQPLAMWRHSARFRRVSGKAPAWHSKTWCLLRPTFTIRSCIAGGRQLILAKDLSWSYLSVEDRWSLNRTGLFKWLVLSFILTTGNWLWLDKTGPVRASQINRSCLGQMPRSTKNCLLKWNFYRKTL